MPRFFFDALDEEMCVDFEGLELPDEVAARLEGARLAAALLLEDPSRLSRDAAWRLRVRDEKNRCCFLLSFGEEPLVARHAPVDAFISGGRLIAAKDVQPC